MPCGYHLDLENGLVTVGGTGAWACKELLSVGRALVADPRFNPELPHLVDLRGMVIDPTSQSSAALRVFTVKTYRPGVRSSVAIVAGDGFDGELMANLYHLVYSLHDIELFDRYENALKWLMRREFSSTAVSR